MAYSFTVSFVILMIMNQIPGLRLRVSEKDEMSGLDASQIGEYAFEALSEKESQWSMSNIMGDAVADEHGGK